MKFREIFRFEFAYQRRRVSTWLCFVVLFLVAFVVMGGSKPANDLLQFSPFSIAFFTVLGGTGWLLIASFVAGEAAARDVSTRMHPLTYTAPVRKAEYLGGRFLAALVLNALILLALPTGLLLAQILAGKPELVGPLRPTAYLTAYGVIARRAGAQGGGR